jgi:hypothetical protein
MSKIQEISKVVKVSTVATAAKPAKPAKAVKPTTAVKAVKPTKAVKPATAVKAAKSTKAVKPATAVKAAKSTKAVKPAKVARPVVPPASFMPDPIIESGALPAPTPEIAHGPLDAGTFAEVIPAIPEEDLGLLPSRYDRNSLYAFPRDPERVFAVWELSGATRGGIGERALVITFRFGDGRKSVDMSDDVDIDLSHYYCAVPRGMLNVSVDLGMRTDTGMVTLMSFGPVGLAIAFERVSDAAFVKVDTTISLAGTSSDSRISAVSPAGVVPQTMMSQDGDAEARRAAFSDMPSSRGK